MAVQPKTNTAALPPLLPFDLWRLANNVMVHYRHQLEWSADQEMHTRTLSCRMTDTSVQLSADTERRQCVPAFTLLCLVHRCAQRIISRNRNSSAFNQKVRFYKLI